MAVVSYPKIGLEINIPIEWTHIDKKEYPKYKLSDQPGIELLDVYLTGPEGQRNLISLSNYGPAEGFIEEYDAELKRIKDRNVIARNENKDWKKVSTIYPLVFKKTTFQKKSTYIAILEAANNPNVNVVQVFFKFNKNIMCYSTTIGVGWRNFEEVLKNNPHVADMLKSLIVQ